nr:hypothetical protein MtrunA17_Chr1g0186451 [Ipomoea batatas]
MHFCDVRLAGPRRSHEPHSDQEKHNQNNGARADFRKLLLPDGLRTDYAISEFRAPLATSMTWLLSALGLSLVTKIGGFGLFFDPGGRPLGRRVVATSIAPSLGSSLFSLSSSSSLPPSFMDIPRSGFFSADDPPADDDVSIPVKPTWPAHHGFAMSKS